jgi:prepilin signal peptidase PulO-like enzyme (type II secretory pathway)
MGLAMTMAGLIGLGAWLGSLWDDWGDHEVAWATVLGAMLGLTLSLVAVFQDSER